MKTKRIMRLLLVVLIIATTAFIWWQSLKNGEDSKKTSIAFQQLFIKLFGEWIQDTFFFEYIRKFAHFAEFALLGVEWCALAQLRERGWRHRWWLLIAGPLTAACDELLQLTSPGRAPAMADVLLDSAGYVCGVLAVGLAALLWRWGRSFRRRRKP